MFPYKGDFCLSIGRSVWIKACRNKDDPALTAAVDNWPNMYVNAWVKVENVLPAVELAGIIPFAVLSADRESIEFHLVLLKTDGTLLVLAGDSLAPESTYNTLHYAISDGSPATSPKWNKIAYWNNQVVAVDGESKAWNLQPNFADSTYTASDSESIEPVTEFTANDGGPVGLRSDGNLWRRIIEAPSAQGQDPNQLWKPWIKADGRTNIGVASPGVILDLSLLTKTLKGRYMDVQSKVYPVVNTIRAFSTTHVFYLKGVLKDADDFSKAGSDPDKQALAIKSAKKFIAHSKTWGMIVSRSVNGVKEGVNIMTKQLNDVKSQLIIQLKLLEAKLVGLEKTLDEQQQAMSKLKAAFWGMVAMAIVCKS